MCLLNYLHLNNTVPDGQFIRGKPNRFGCKLWSLCGASGYCFKFDLYCGKDPEDTARDDLLLGSRQLGLPERIESLTVHYELKKTVRGNYDYQFDRNGEDLFVRWHDNRCVYNDTNFHQVESLGAATRYSRQESKKTQVQQPAVLKVYNAYMGGVDHHDRLAHGKNAQDLLDFRCAVTVTYLKLDCGRPNIRRPMEYPSSQLRVIPDIRFDGIGHMIDKRSTQTRCVKAKCNGKPKTYCVKCLVTLCVKSIVPFHKK
ncbi:piggyBac transposable element-derived protein 3-like [Schistocerca piceifrons]|uniref:piggyBac transposable element-derived protein 3-like n=1 Tax=Schistocerca piceifrons TaxID=274613 RepID=UPI001F5F9E51|nr:piggyBac transposable element-derived protein 3-like [Schistocerca piceifrons]